MTVYAYHEKQLIFNVLWCHNLYMILENVDNNSVFFIGSYYNGGIVVLSFI